MLPQGKDLPSLHIYTTAPGEFFDKSRKYTYSLTRYNKHDQVKNDKKAVFYF